MKQIAATLSSTPITTRVCLTLLRILSVSSFVMSSNKFITGNDARFLNHFIDVSRHSSPCELDMRVNEDTTTPAMVLDTLMEMDLNVMHRVGEGR